MSPQQIAIIITAALAALLEIIDSSIVNVAIPTMMGNLGVTLDEISWVSTAYMIANSIVLPIAAWLGSRLGRKTYFTAAISIFTIASFACGLAPNLVTLVFFRVIQGLAGGALLPTSQTLIQEQFPPEQSGMAMALFGMCVMIGPALGPTMGGYLTDNFGWRSIFNINVPLGLGAAILSSLNVTNAPRAPLLEGEKRAGVDWTGLFFLVVGVGFFQYVLERGEAEGWDTRLIRCSEFLAFLGCSLFIWWELRVKNPIMNLRLFKHNAVSAGTMLMLALGVMVYALTFVVPIFVSNVVQLTATQTGMLFFPGSVCTAFVMYFVGKSMRFVSPKILVLIGIAIAESAVITMSHFTTATGAGDIYVPLILRGVGTAFLFIPINGMVLGQFRGEALGQVAGMMNFFRQIGGSIGIASLSTLITRFGDQNYTDLMAHVNALNPTAWRAFNQAQGSQNSKLLNNVGFGDFQTLGVKSLWVRVQQQVFVMSFSQLCWVIMFVFALSVIPLYFIRVKGKVQTVMDAH